MAWLGWMRQRADRLSVVALALTLVVSVYAVYDNWRAFHVVEATYAPHADSDLSWTRPDHDAAGFRQVDLPFWLDQGRFRVRFQTDRERLDLSMYAVDCLNEVYLDGERIYDRNTQCRRCDAWNFRRTRRCRSVPVEIAVEPGEHLLAITTINHKASESNQQRDIKLLFLHYKNAAFGFRLTALTSLAGLLWLWYSRRRTGKATELPRQGFRALWVHRALVGILLFSVVPKLVVAPSFVTTDVSQSAMIYTENLVNRKDWHFAAVSEDYTAAKYWGASHMHKPPGVYYQYAIPRLLFGFTEAYYPHMARLPGILGDWIIAWVIWSVVRARRGDGEGTIAAGLFVLSTGVFITTGYVGRIDSLAIGLLMLALHNIDRTRFALYFGAAVAWKQLALLCAPLLLTSLKRFRGLLLAGLVAFALCAPYLLDDPKLFLERLTMPQLNKEAGGLSWMMNLKYWDIDSPDTVSKIVTLCYMGSLCLLPIFTKMGVWTSGAVAFGMFVAASKNVYEHYILWSIPFLLILVFTHRSMVAMACFGLGTTSMTLRTELKMFLVSDTVLHWSLMLAIVFFLMCVYFVWVDGHFKEAFLARAIQRLRQRPRTQSRVELEPGPENG